jgi:hypothetical protein
MFSFHLLFRLMILNACIVAGVIWGILNGYVQVLFAADTTGMGYGLVLMFAAAMVGFSRRAYKTSLAMNDVKMGKWVDARKFHIKSLFVIAFSVWLVTVGLLGNILGFSIAVENLDVSGGTDAALEAIGLMIDGMKIAFYTTFIGMALGLWMAVNAHVLNVATALLAIDAEDLRR